MRAVLERVNDYTGRNRPIVPWPLALIRFQAAFIQMMPMAPLTRDQMRLLETDNVVGEGSLGLADLGIVPTLIDAVVSAYLGRYRRAGAALA